ncbi:MAG: DUF362 domain-containing protein [Proteobacteria bacterium]|nr:DUF362 domain-containing protein [Pseudomonadota bacterium]
MLRLLAENGIKFYRTDGGHPWGGPTGIIDANDVVLIKVNCQWKCRGTTNTDVLRGLIYRILQQPDGFGGEVVIFENGQGEGSFYGDPRSWGHYSPWPEIDNGIYVNAEEETILTVDYLVNTVFKVYPVSSYLLDPIRSNFISDSDHLTDGYRKTSDVSYPCFTSAGGHRIELREGIWNGSGYDTNLKLINLPVLKTHEGTGITGILKHSYGILSMADGYSGIRHYSESGTQCGKMWSLVRIPDLNILDCIWVSHESLGGYPPETTYRTNILLGGTDPVALDYYGSKHVLLPLGGSRAHEHDPDSFSGLINHLTGARDFINANGGIGGEVTHVGDDNIELISASAFSSAEGGSTGGGGVGGCFIATAAYGSRMAKDVKVLQRVRDTWLLTNRVGRAFVSFYYKQSPKLANHISRRPLLRSIVRAGLYPLVQIGRLVIETGKDRRQGQQ